MVTPPDELFDGPRRPPTAARPVRPVRPGELSRSWSIAMTVAWVGVVVALAAVWNVSRQLGLATWWLGPRAQPRSVLVTMLPFVPAALVVAATISRVRWVALLGLLAAAAIAVVGALDLGEVTSLAVTQLVIAGAGALVSLASLAGTYRRAEPDR